MKYRTLADLALTEGERRALQQSGVLVYPPPTEPPPRLVSIFKLDNAVQDFLTSPRRKGLQREISLKHQVPENSLCARLRKLGIRHRQPAQPSPETTGNGHSESPASPPTRLSA